MSRAWRTGCVLLALGTFGTISCSEAGPPAPGEIQRLIAQIAQQDTEGVIWAAFSQTYGLPYDYYYTPEMLRLIEIGKLAVPLLVQQLQELQEQEHADGPPWWDIGDVIVAMLGDIGDPAATEAIVAYARQWSRWDKAARGYGDYELLHIEALGKVGRKLIGEPNGRERLQKLVDFFEEVYYRVTVPAVCVRSGHDDLVKALVAIGEEEEARFYVMSLLVRATGDLYSDYDKYNSGAGRAVVALRRWTGQGFGYDSRQWAEWLKKKYPDVRWDVAPPSEEPRFIETP